MRPLDSLQVLEEPNVETYRNKRRFVKGQSLLDIGSYGQILKGFEDRHYAIKGIEVI